MDLKKVNTCRPGVFARKSTLFFAAAACLFAWLAMQIVHEAGHVLHAWLSGGTVARVVLYPLAISRTDVSPNPHPLVVAWGGPVWGCAFPPIGLAAARGRLERFRPLLQFFAGFCLIANGAYLGLGVTLAVGDAADLLAYGTPRWALGAFGLIACSSGLWLWHRLGPRFGLPEAGVQPRSAAVLWSAVAGSVVAELLLSPRM